MISYWSHNWKAQSTPQTVVSWDEEISTVCSVPKLYSKLHGGLIGDDASKRNTSALKSEVSPNAMWQHQSGVGT